MTGFFTKQETQSKDRPNGKIQTCYSCGLFKNCTTPKMQPYGNFKKGILNIGKAPTQLDDSLGKYWQGKAGKWLKSVYSKFGVDLFEDCLNINAVNCYTPDELTNVQIECCRKNILNVIHKYKPKLIMVFGDSAIHSILAYRWFGSLNSINEWRGFIIPDQEFNAWVCPVFDPDYVLKMDKPEIATVWRIDLENAFDKLNTDFPVYTQPEIKVIEDLNELNKIKYGIISIDYETTGLKPYAKGHRIVCASIAINENEAFTFEMPKEVDKREPFLKILRNTHIKKMAHNMKFEDTWSFVRLKTKIKGWDFDSMLAAHLLDNRSGITGLKFQTYVNLGIVNYNINVEQYLKPVHDKNANSKNRLQDFFNTEIGKREVLRYCGLDTINQYRLAVMQKQKFEVLTLRF